MEASSVYIKTEIEDAEYERSYNYSSNDTLVNNDEDYTVTVNPEAVLDIKYERGKICVPLLQNYMFQDVTVVVSIAYN